MIKNYMPLSFVLILLSSFSFSQEKELKSPIINDITLIANTTYIVPQEILLTNGSILTIEEGVILKNNNNPKITISIENGSKVIASGSYENPITATSNDVTNKKPMIIMKSSTDRNSNAIANNQFYYKSIENPTILMNSQPLIQTEISSIQPNF
ncbi:hypothetical protein [Aquimarina sp. Aq107]|uniref:hypothetical protein n=1 Tax=Aquimarina sp. Aq107 TaxID=1191912 RepID=UPI00131EED9C|nr:hypothetical protein [Aquimarina sp. Aq107]